MRATFQLDGHTLSFDEEPEDSECPATILHYFAWLAEDAELAQQVADAWNELVRRGEAGKIKCDCQKCQLVAWSEG